MNWVQLESNWNGLDLTGINWFPTGCKRSTGLLLVPTGIVLVSNRTETGTELLLNWTETGLGLVVNRNETSFTKISTGFQQDL